MQVIDALVVTLGLDAKDFEKGSKQVDSTLDNTRKKTEKAGKDIAASGKQSAEFFGQMQKAALKFFGVLAAARGITSFVTQTISMGANLSRASRNLNLSANDLNKWGNAVKQNGGTMEGFLGTMQGLSQQLTEIQMTGQSAMTPLLNFLNVGVADATGKAKQLDALILDIAEAMERSGMSRSDKFNWLTGSGFDAGTANVILKGRKEAAELVAKQVGMTDQMAKKMEEQEQRWIAVQDQVRKIATDVLEKILPAVEKITPLIGGMVDGFVALNETTDGWLATILAAAVALKGVSALMPSKAAASAGGAAGAAAGGGVMAFLAKLGVGAAAAGYHGSLNSNEDAELARRRTMGATIDVGAGSLKDQIAAAEKSSGLPAGLLASVMQQEIGGRKEFIDDPSKYHYEPDANGRRKSSAFGPFGILDSTAKDPGYGVSPLQNKSIEEQMRFASQYLAARIKAAGGSVAAGLSGYGEGAKYANQVLGRIPDITGGGVMSGVSGAGAGRGATTNNTTLNFYSSTTDAKTAGREAASYVAQANAGMF